jgi:hypothetical protein
VDYAGNPEGDKYSSESGTIIEVPYQKIALSTGWNIISSFIIPYEPGMMNDVFKKIKDSVVIVKNNEGHTYIPEYEIDDIGKWDETQGYQIYMRQADTLIMSGIQVSPGNTPIQLNTGWNMISYLRHAELDCETAFAGLTDDSNLVIVKDNEGNVYIPAYDINGIGNLIPGKGYQIYVVNADTLVFPEN